MTEEISRAIATRTTPTAVSIGQRGMNLDSLEAAWRFATGIIQGGMAPKGMREPGAVVAIIEAGMELGLPPMFALSNLTFVNGRLGIMGDAAKALVISSGKLRPGTAIRCRYEGEGDALCAVVSSHRADEAEPSESRFSVADAKKAQLWGKAGPWTQYPRRMLYYRALGFHLRDQYPDALMGTVIREELDDYPTNPKGRPERDVTPPSGLDPLLEPAAEVEIQTADEPEPEDGFALDGGES